MALAEQYIEDNPLDEPHLEDRYYTEAEYFEFERTAFGRWEYVNGKIHSMAGGADDHNLVSTNIARALGNVLVPRGCRVYGSDMKIHTGDGVNTFPDVAVVCGERHYYLGKKDIVLNPLLVVEVLSPSTEGYDRAGKFDHYRTIETLQEYLVVEPDKPLALLHTRRDDDWEMREIKGIESTFSLSSVNVELDFSDVYALIKFDAEQL